MYLQTAQLSDRAAVTAVLRRAYAVLLSPDYPAEVLKVTLPIISYAKPALLRSGQYFAVRLAEDQPIIGVGGWSDDVPRGAVRRPGLGHIRHVAVDPAFTRMGVASRLMNHILANAAAAGITQMSCFSTLSAEAFYRSQGFKSLRRSSLPLAQNTPFEIVEMERTIRSRRVRG